MGTIKKLTTLLPIACFTLLSACGGGGGSDGGSGSVSLGVTDAPVDDAARVIVEFTGVTLQRAGDDDVTFTFDGPREIDLLTLTGDDADLLLDDEDVPAGNYQQIRLDVNAPRPNQCGSADISGSRIVLGDGTIEPLAVPSQRGLRLVSGFIVPAGGNTEFTIDFDLRKAVTNPQGRECHFLRPALRLIDNTEVGSISGTVDMTLLDGTNGMCTDDDPQTGNAVYVYEGSGVTPDDIDGNEPEPITSASVALNDAGEFEYTAGFLTAGDYTVAFTCQAGEEIVPEAENPDAVIDNDLQFQQSADVTVNVNDDTEQDFTP